MKVGIIGAGKIGLALKHILSPNHEVKTWDNDPTKNKVGENLAETVAGADFLFLAVPSWSIRIVCQNIQTYLEAKTIVISLAKGLEEKTLKSADEILLELLPAGQSFFILGGPLLAGDLNAGGLGFGVAASTNKSAYAEILDLFKNTPVALEYSGQPHEVAWAGILKNIYAVLIGIADGLNWSENAKGWLMTRAISEMELIAKKLSLTSDIIISTPGLADFIATSFCKNSNNRSCGEGLVTNGVLPTKKNEGLTSTPLLVKLLDNKTADLKLLTALIKITEKPAETKEILEAIIKSR